MRRAGWCCGHTTQLPLLWPWVDSQTCCHMWVEFFVGSYPCSEVYSPSLLGFFPPEILTFYIPIQPGNSGQEELPRGMSTAKCPLFPLSFPYYLQQVAIFLSVVWHSYWDKLLKLCQSFMHAVFKYRSCFYPCSNMQIKLVLVIPIFVAS